MKKTLFTALLLVSMTLTACSPSSDSGKTASSQSTQKTIKVATEGNMYPWTYTEDGKIVGYEADIMDEISKRTGYDIKLEAIDWSGIFGALDSGRVDTIADIITITDERKQKYDFTQPYVYNPMVLATKSSNTDINSMKDINGKTIVVEVGSSDELVLDQVQKKYSVTLKPKYYDGISIKDVENGRVDLWIGGKPSITTQIKKGDYDLKIVGETGYHQEYGYPFRKDENGKALLSAFDTALSEMKKDGTLKKISEKWFDMDITTEESINK